MDFQDPARLHLKPEALFLIMKQHIRIGKVQSLLERCSARDLVLMHFCQLYSKLVCLQLLQLRHQLGDQLTKGEQYVRFCTCAIEQDAGTLA